MNKPTPKIYDSVAVMASFHTPFPIRIKMTPSAIEALADAEYGSFEDMQRLTDNRETDIERPIETHTYTVCKRAKSVLIIRNKEEAEDVYFAVCSGTFALQHEQGSREGNRKEASYLRWAKKIADILRPHVNEELKTRWPTPTGM